MTVGAGGPFGVPAPDAAVYVISVAAELTGLHPQTLRAYERMGLITPGRTVGGGRRYSHRDVERLRYVLTCQRERFYPLKVIREHLDAMDRGLDPPAAAGEPARAPQSRPDPEADMVDDDAPDRLRMSRLELLASSGLTDEQLTAFVGYGLLSPVAGTDHYDGTALRVATTLAATAGYGLEPRHVRAYKTAAERQVGLIGQVAAPYRAQRGGDAQARAADVVRHLGQLSVQLHAALVDQGLAGMR